MLTETQRQYLLDKIGADILDAQGKARLNYRISYSVYGLAFFGSLLGTLLPLLAENDLARKAGAVAALLPAVALSAMTSFRFNRKSDWHYERLAWLKEIEKQISIRPVEHLQEIVDWWNKVERDLNRRWPGFGEFPGAPHDGSNRDIRP